MYVSRLIPSGKKKLIIVIASFVWQQGIQKFSECYEHAAEFLCTYALPQCGMLSFPEFPCKSMCREFRARCAHKLNESEAIDRLINCDSLADDHLNPNAGCFKLDHTTPTIAPPSNGKRNMICMYACRSIVDLWLVHSWSLEVVLTWGDAFFSWLILWSTCTSKCWKIIGAVMSPS